MKPIIFASDSVRAILDGSKTQTRRVIKPQPDENGYVVTKDAAGKERRRQFGEVASAIAPHKPGDILYVREKWRLVDFQHIDGVWSASVQFADNAIGERLRWEHMEDERIGWRPSIHMRRAAARIFLRVTNVKTEKINEISNGDCIKEGVSSVCNGCDIEWDKLRTECEQYDNGVCLVDTKFMYAVLWDSIKGKKPGCSWADNPWVFVYSFERVEKPEGAA